ncbi:MAG: hypothetical protein AAGJ28_07195 [Pseudomonadota bacterium]
MKIVHDPAASQYRMAVRLTSGTWSESPSFGISFRGGRELTIGTDRHRIAGDTLSVADTGFDNVLNGLEFNLVAIAFTTDQTLQLSLAGAAEEVRKFKSCIEVAPPLA